MQFTNLLLMYSICKIIYGVVLTREIQEAYEAIDSDAEQDFETLYTGMGDETPGFLGESLIDLDGFGTFNLEKVFDKCKQQVNERMFIAVNQKIDALPEEVKALIGEPGMYGVWYTS